MPTPSPSRMRPRTRPGTRFPEVLDVSLTAQCLIVQDAALARAPVGYARGGLGKGHGHFLPRMFRVAPCAKMAPQLVSRVSPGLQA